MRWLHGKLAGLPLDILVTMTVMMLVQVFITIAFLVFQEAWIIALTYLNLLVYFAVIFVLARRRKKRRQEEARMMLETSEILRDLFGKKP